MKQLSIQYASKKEINYVINYVTMFVRDNEGEYI